MPKKSTKLAEIAELKFRPLKKNLRNSFKQLRNSIDSGKMPDKKALDQFMDEATLMTKYPGFGDEFYDPFLAACQELRVIHNSKELTAFKEQIATIRSLKKQCHNQFK